MTEQPIRLPDPDAIRAEIDVVDERARLLRRLLRLVILLQAFLPDRPPLKPPPNSDSPRRA